MARQSDSGEVTTEKKSRKASGPRKAKPTYVLFRVTGPDGSPVTGARLEVVIATKDSDAFMDAQDQNPDAIRTKVSL